MTDALSCDEVAAVHRGVSVGACEKRGRADPAWQPVFSKVAPGYTRPGCAECGGGGGSIDPIFGFLGDTLRHFTKT